MHTMHIDTKGAARDLLAIAAEIQTALHISSGEALRLAITQREQPTLPPDIGPIAVHTSIAIPPVQGEQSWPRGNGVPPRCWNMPGFKSGVDHISGGSPGSTASMSPAMLDGWHSPIPLHCGCVMTS